MSLQMHHLGSNLREGDVILTNHPAAGGSHLPDLTVITPVLSHVFLAIVCGLCIYVFRYSQVFYPGSECPVFFVANRGHHADIGGITPG